MYALDSAKTSVNPVVLFDKISQNLISIFDWLQVPSGHQLRGISQWDSEAFQSLNECFVARILDLHQQSEDKGWRRTIEKLIPSWQSVFKLFLQTSSIGSPVSSPFSSFRETEVKPTDYFFEDYDWNLLLCIKNQIYFKQWAQAEGLLSHFKIPFFKLIAVYAMIREGENSVLEACPAILSTMYQDVKSCSQERLDRAYLLLELAYIMRKHRREESKYFFDKAKALLAKVEFPSFDFDNKVASCMRAFIAVSLFFEEEAFEEGVGITLHLAADNISIGTEIVRGICQRHDVFAALIEEKGEEALAIVSKLIECFQKIKESAHPREQPKLAASMALLLVNHPPVDMRTCDALVNEMTPGPAKLEVLFKLREQTQPEDQDRLQALHSIAEEALEAWQKTVQETVKKTPNSSNVQELLDLAEWSMHFQMDHRLGIFNLIEDVKNILLAEKRLALLPNVVAIVQFEKKWLPKEEFADSLRKIYQKMPKDPQTIQISNTVYVRLLQFEASIDKESALKKLEQLKEIAFSALERKQNDQWHDNKDNFDLLFEIAKVEDTLGSSFDTLEKMRHLLVQKLESGKKIDKYAPLFVRMIEMHRRSGSEEALKAIMACEEHLEAIPMLSLQRERKELEEKLKTPLKEGEEKNVRGSLEHLQRRESYLHSVLYSSQRSQLVSNLLPEGVQLALPITDSIQDMQLQALSTIQAMHALETNTKLEPEFSFSWEG